MDSAAKAGAVTLPAGTYSVHLKNNQAIFENTNTDKTFSVPVNVQKEAKKFSQTAVETRKQNGQDVIQNIQLGGTPNQLKFGA